VPHNRVILQLIHTQTELLVYCPLYVKHYINTAFDCNQEKPIECIKHYYKQVTCLIKFNFLVHTKEENTQSI